MRNWRRALRRAAIPQRLPSAAIPWLKIVGCVDIDFKRLSTPPDEVRTEVRSLPLPFEIRESGGGLHVLANLKEAYENGTEHYQRAEALRTQLTELLCGDPAPNHSAAILRVVGSHNSKYGEPVEVRVVAAGEAVDLTDVDHTAAITAVAASGATNGLALNAAALIALVTPGVVTKTSGSSSGSVNLGFSAPSTAFAYLSAGVMHAPTRSWRGKARFTGILTGLRSPATCCGGPRSGLFCQATTYPAKAS